MAREAWWERGDGCWRARRGNPMASQGSEAVARRKVNSSECPLLVLGGVLGKVKLPLCLHSCTWFCFKVSRLKIMPTGYSRSVRTR